MEHVGALPLLSRHAVEIHLSKIDVADELVGVVVDDRDVPARRQGGAPTHQLAGCGLHALERGPEGVVGATFLQQLFRTTILASAAAADAVNLIYVPVHGDQLEVQLRDRVEIGVIRHVIVLADRAVHASLLRVQLVRAVSLRLGRVRPRAPASSRAGLAGAAGKVGVDVRAARARVRIAIVVVAHHREPRHPRELGGVDVDPSASEATGARPVPIEVVATRQDEQQVRVRIARLPVPDILCHLLCNLELHGATAVGTPGAGALVRDHEVEVVGEPAWVAAHPACTRSDVEIVRRSIEVWVVPCDRGIALLRTPEVLAAVRQPILQALG
mmetsp:Transcript_6034/g.22829  ORF Transcript_6034/g.22829 Transcript_6034/m.22829 type:complete len:329 (+) Transcript_6034:436-1422(+)